MLVLSRKRNESIVIGGLDGSPIIEVCVVEIRGDKVRLGIAAPRDMPVHRAEVFHALAARQAAGEHHATEEVIHDDSPVFP